MARSYDEFLKAVTDSGMTEKISKYDMEAAKKNPDLGFSLLNLAQQYDQASTQEQKALLSETANQLRSSAGYRLGDDGAYQAVSAPANTGYDRELDYQAAVSDVTNIKPFEYDPEKDNTYKTYEQKYLRQGEIAARDTLARAAAMTGGRPSSYAISAAQQTRNNYGAALAGMIPTLEQNAYQKYLNEYDTKMSALGVLSEDRAKFLTEKQKQEQQTYNNALALFETYGYATPEIAAVLGIPEGTRYPTEQAAVTEIPASTLALLKDSYGDGKVTDADLWKDLETRYGADALEKEGYFYYDKGADIAFLQKEYPEGKVSRWTWDNLMKQYDESVLKEAGISVEVITPEVQRNQEFADLLIEYPNKQITDEATWRIITRKYGTKALLDAGFSFVRGM